MINVREYLQRDYIIFCNTCVNGIYYDSILHRFQYNCRTDDKSYSSIRKEMQVAGLEFSTECFNDFVSSARGVSNEIPLMWERTLLETMILPGERFRLNDGRCDALELLKISGNSYMITDLNSRSDIHGIELLQILYTDGKQIFGQGKVNFDALPDYQIERICLLPPRRINRAVDNAIGNHYARNVVSNDISELVHNTLRALHENDFILQFKKLLAEITSNGVSSWALRGIADAYLKKLQKQ